jgi:lysophospholipase L1-like esterase
MRKILLIASVLLCLVSTTTQAQRDPLKWPFDKTSIWNLPIHNNAVYVPAGIQPAANFEVDEDIIFMTPNEAPIDIETNYTGWNAGGDARCADQGPVLLDNMPIPQSYIYSPTQWHGSTPNAGAAILMPDGRIIQTQPFAKCSEGFATSLYKWENNCDLTGECIEGAHGGSHLSAIGGTLRVGELTSGVIKHVLKINLWGRENFYNGNGGHRWPAPQADGGYNDPSQANYYGGTNPEMRVGALLALNKDVVLESLTNNSLGLQTEAGLIIARALKNYGAYTVDNTAWDTYAIISEIGPAGRVSDEFKSLYGYDMNYYGNPNTPWASDINKIFANLFVISNNAEGNVGGGPTTDLTNRLAPPAPDFAAAQTIKIMPLGDSKTEGQGGNGQSSYRGFLRTRLIASGYNIDYVGPQKNYANGDTIPNDFDHAGFGGYTIGPDINKFCQTCQTTGLYEHIQDYLPQADPDIVLVAVGVNDMFNASIHPPDYAATAPHRYKNLIKKIQTLKPGVRIIVGTIEPVKWDKNWGSDPNDRNLGALNAAIKALADSSTTDNIFFADVRNRMLVDYGAQDFYDDLHLSETGAKKSADAWFTALVPVIEGIPNNTAPTVQITNPASNSTVNAPATINIEVAASDSDGQVTKVEFYRNNKKVGEDTTPPFSFTLNNVDEGTYIIHAVAIDNLYRSAKSSDVLINVTSTDGFIKFQGTGIGSPGSYGGSGLTFDKALDGDASTFFDAPSANGQWVGLDLGAAKVVKKVRYIPRASWAARMVDGIIQAANAPDFSDAVNLFTITEVPVEGSYTTARFENNQMYQYYRFLSPTNGYGNVAEIEFWGDPNSPVNQAPSVDLIAPVNGSTFVTNASILLSATASDVDGSISRVDFYNNGSLIGSDNTQPFNMVWESVPAGSYSLIARAVDNTNVSKNSAVSKITVASGTSVVLYSEDFNANTSLGWQSNGGTWTATSQRYRSSNTNGEFTSFYNGRNFTNYTYKVDATADWNNDIGVVFNYADANNYYVLTFNSNSKTAALKKKKGGSVSTVASGTFVGNGTGTRHSIEIVNSTASTTIKINGNVIFDNVSTVDFTSGKIGLYSFYCPSSFDNVIVTSNNAAPIVTLTAPLDSVTVNANSSIALSATASDSDGSIAKVDFYQGNVLIGSDNTEPYSFTWANVAAGNYYVTAKATDNFGLEVFSSLARVFVKTVNESIGFYNPPMTLTAGSTYNVDIDYSAAQSRIIDLYLYDQSWRKIASKHVTVTAGSGRKSISITVPANTTPTTGGIWAVNLWKSDWSGVVKSATRTGVKIQSSGTSMQSAPLVFTSVCSSDPSVRRWRLINNTDSVMEVSWRVYGSTQSGSLAVLAHEIAFFETTAEAGSNTTIVTYSNGKQITKASSNQICQDAASSGTASVDVYPVPVKDKLTVKVQGFENPRITIRDLLNAIVYEENISADEVNVEGIMRSGIYLLIVEDAHVRMTRRIVVE